MLQNTDKVRVENRQNAIVCYRVPDEKITRHFEKYETKEISMDELRRAVQVAGTRRLIQDDLIIHSKEAVDELFPSAEPEYFYNAKDVDFLLERGTYDQLLDALDFAPDGVIQLIKDEAVRTCLNDMRKREAILDRTGFDVTKAIENRRLAQTEEKEEVKVRRTAPITDTTTETSADAPARRTTAPRFKVNISQS